MTLPATSPYATNPVIINVSSKQPYINAVELRKAGVAGIVARAVYSPSLQLSDPNQAPVEDSSFARHCDEAAKAGLPFGALIDWNGLVDMQNWELSEIFLRRTLKTLEFKRVHFIVVTALIPHYYSGIAKIPFTNNNLRLGLNVFCAKLRNQTGKPVVIMSSRAFADTYMNNYTLETLLDEQKYPYWSTYPWTVGAAQVTDFEAFKSQITPLTREQRMNNWYVGNVMPALWLVTPYTTHQYVKDETGQPAAFGYNLFTAGNLNTFWAMCQFAPGTTPEPPTSGDDPAVPPVTEDPPVELVEMLRGMDTIIREIRSKFS